MMKKNTICLATAGVILAFISCKTVDLEEAQKQQETIKTAETADEEARLNEEEIQSIVVADELKVQDVEDTIVYVDRPVYIPAEKNSEQVNRIKGKEAVTESAKRSIKSPEHYKNGTFYYQYDENLVYEVYAQTYHLTDIILEPGEVVMGTPLLSEDESVWELTANVAKDSQTGFDVQHLFVKPAYSGLDSTLVIITDKRVYHLRVKSYKDTHMAMVKFTYPMTRNVWAKKKNEDTGRTVENDFITVTNPEFLSFDYKIKYSIFKRPEFLPKRVYDDGQKTYIQVDDIVLQKKLPLCFNERNEIVNYSVSKNTFTIPRLINKITLRLGKQKVIIEKKKSTKKEIKQAETQEETDVRTNGAK